MITVDVKEQQEVKPEDIFFQGNYVISERGNIVHVSAEKGASLEEFAGQLIKAEDGYFSKSGHYSKGWRRNAFTQFTGTITITSK